VFENSVLRRIFAQKSVGTRGGMGKLRNEELHSLHSSLNIMRMIKSIRMRWAEHAALMGVKRNN
jgi:hypothetical protein